ncbi:MAG: SHOCT domain-containing protein [Nitrosopumilaceae archaeon]
MKTKSILFLTSLILISNILPVFAEVTEIHLDNNSYQRGDSINVKGTVSDDSSGLVTIVLRDPADKFVLLSQTIIQSNSSFEKNISINEKFQVPGKYNATAFVLNMTAGKTQSFNFNTISVNENAESNNDSLLSISELDSLFEEDSLSSISELDSLLEDDSEITNVVLDSSPIVEENKMDINSNQLTENQSQVAEFVDKTKKPEYYLERYYNEPTYKSWFDRNYPNLTIEEAIGYNPPSEMNSNVANANVVNEIIPEAEAISVDTSASEVQNNRDLAPMGLALGGLAILLGAVYGIKRKADTNSKNIHLNKEKIKQKIISSISHSNPLSIIKTRLAKGEISIKEYEFLKQEIEKISK